MAVAFLRMRGESGGSPALSLVTRMKSATLVISGPLLDRRGDQRLPEQVQPLRVQVDETSLFQILAGSAIMGKAGVVAGRLAEIDIRDYGVVVRFVNLSRGFQDSDASTQGRNALCQHYHALEDISSGILLGRIGQGDTTREDPCILKLCPRPGWFSRQSVRSGIGQGNGADPIV